MFLCIDFYASTSTKCTKSQYKVTDDTLLYGATKFQSLVPSGNLPAFLLTLIIPSRYIATSGSLLISTISWFFACITFDATPVSLSISPQIRFNMSEASLVRSRGPAGWHPQCHLRAKLCNYGKSPNIFLDDGGGLVQLDNFHDVIYFNLNWCSSVTTNNGFFNVSRFPSSSGMP